MTTVKVLNREEIQSIMTMPDAIQAVEAVYVMKHQGQTDLMPIVTHDFEQGVSDFDIKTGAIAGMGIYGMKTVSYFANNQSQGLPNLAGVLTLYDIQNGFPIGILEASYITCLRTGAAGAIGVKYLARQDAKHLLIVGSGKQALFQVAAILCVKQNLQSITIYDKLSLESATSMANTLADSLQTQFGIALDSAITVTATADIQTATKASDIIMTCTPAREALVDSSWVQPGTHFSCIGSDTTGKQEIDAKIMANARIFVDDRTQCINVGEIETAIKQGIITADDIVGELGAVIAGEQIGRQDDRQITVFDSTGLALQDLATGGKVLTIANEKNIGTTITL